MDIGNLIKQYRKKHKISLRDFAEECGISHSYIAMLESGKNSKTGEKIIPTITMLKKVSIGLHLSLTELIAVCDDIPITLSDIADIKTSPSESDLSEREKEWLKLFRELSEDEQDFITLKVQKLLDALKDIN